VTRFPANADTFDGLINVGFLISEPPSSIFRDISVQMERSFLLFCDWLNGERGGVRVGGRNYAFRVSFVDYSSTVAGVGAALGELAAAEGAVCTVNGTNDTSWHHGRYDFVIGPYSSTLTLGAARATGAAGQLMLAPAATIGRVLALSPLSFGTLGSATTILKAPMHLWALAAEGLDAGSSHVERTSRSCGDASTGCRGSLRVGMLQYPGLFAQELCVGALQEAAAWNVSVTPPVELPLDVMPVPNLSQLLGGMKAAGVNLLFGCVQTRAQGAGILKALELADFSPYGVSMPLYNEVPGAPWLHEYLSYANFWTKERPGRGNFTRLTSTEFSDRFAATYYGARPDNVGASVYACGAVLAHGIELADSLEPLAVAAALRSLTLSEFFSTISFDAYGQNEMSNLVQQLFPSHVNHSRTVERLVFTDGALLSARLAFPMPVIAQRRCRFETASDAGAECHGHGTCDEEGACTCLDGYDAAVSCAHRPPLDPVALFLQLTTAGVVAAIVAAWRVRLFWHHRRKKRLVVMLRQPAGGFATTSCRRASRGRRSSRTAGRAGRTRWPRSARCCSCTCPASRCSSTCTTSTTSRS